MKLAITNAEINKIKKAVREAMRLEGETDIKNYRFEEVTSLNLDSSYIETKMNELREKGWIDLAFRTCISDIEDLSIIYGYRPLTKKEIRLRKSREESEKKEELKTLKKLAKKHGFTLMAD